MIRAPAELSHLASLLGDAALLRLIEGHGGTRLYVPQTPGAELTKLVGDKGALLLCEAHGGTWIKVPLAKHWRARLYAQAGKPYREIALALGISEDTVWRALRGRQEERKPEAERLTAQMRMDV